MSYPTVLVQRGDTFEIRQGAYARPNNWTQGAYFVLASLTPRRTSSGEFYIDVPLDHSAFADRITLEGKKSEDFIPQVYEHALSLAKRIAQDSGSILFDETNIPFQRARR